MNDSGNGDFRTEKSPEKVQLDGPPELVFRRFCDGTVVRGGATGIVVKDVELSVFSDGGINGGRDALGIGYVASNEVSIAPVLCLFSC